MENQEIKSYNFSNVRYSQLEDIVDISIGNNLAKFNEWFQTPYEINEQDVLFFGNLIEKHRTYIGFYMEEDLKAKFIIPILNLVDFMVLPVRDWYDGTLSGELNGVKFRGFTDFMVATGIDQAKKPYFFIQEFKPSIPDKDPKVQLLAELLVTIEKNKTTIMRGGYIIGQYWNFVIVEKIGENQYEFVISKSFDSLDLEDLKQIYIILQAVKHKYCKD
jgi:hypothetical protein